jgi:hypothetical protein
MYIQQDSTKIKKHSALVQSDTNITSHDETNVTLYDDTNLKDSLPQQTTEQTKSHKHKKFDEIFVPPKENAVENIVQQRTIQELDRKVQEVISKADKLIETNHLDVTIEEKESQWQDNQDSQELDSIISQLEEVSNED